LKLVVIKLITARAASQVTRFTYERSDGVSMVFVKVIAKKFVTVSLICGC
jgi:hypothetical protein